MCGYEVYRRGRCHQCRRSLVASSLPELEQLDADEEVGYRLSDWSDTDRGRLIVALNAREVRHRFEDDDLVVAIDDEAKVDGLIDRVTSRAARTEAVDEDVSDEGGLDGVRVEVLIPVYESSARLRTDPTDMQADAVLAEASAGVFLLEACPGLDEESWNAVGRVTRRLLAALGAEDALEDEIRLQAGVLHKLLEPAMGEQSPFYLEAPTPDEAPEDEEEADVATARSADDASDDDRSEDGDEEEAPDAEEGSGGEVAEQGVEDGAAEQGVGDESEADDWERQLEVEDEAAGGEDEAAGGGAEDAGGGAEDEDDEAGHGNGSEPAAVRGVSETVYELAEWLPEQRALLSIDFEEAEIRHRWEGPDVVVAAADEAKADAVFEDFETPYDSDDDEDTYRAIEELFAATGRLAGDPTDSERATAFVEAAPAASSAVPLGLDEALWLQVRSQTHRLVELVVSHDDYEKVNHDRVLHAAESLRNLLRTMV